MRGPNPLKLDPTRTKTLRDRLAARIRGKLTRVKKAIYQLLIDEDAFGMVMNVFCPTGKGGGVDPSCKAGGGKGLTPLSHSKLRNLTKHDYQQIPGWSGATHKGRSYGGAIFDDRGRILLREPAGHFDGYVWTFPKGGCDSRSDNPTDAALREVAEETGHRGQICGLVPQSFKGGTSKMNLFIMKSKGKNVDLMDEETQQVKWFTFKEAVQAILQTKNPIGRKRDLQALIAAYKEKGAIEDGSSLVNKVLGLTQNMALNTRWQFMTTPQKVEAFKRWLWKQFNDQVMPKHDEEWLNTYIEDAYKGGMGRAFDLAKYPALAEKLSWYAGTKKEFLASAFGRPVSIDRVKLLAGRAFDDLKGISQAMSNDISRHLVQGFIAGQSPRTIAAAMAKSIDKMTKARAATIANTEIIRAHNEGQLDMLENLGVTEIGVAVEWSTSGLGITAKGNPSPCAVCGPLKGVVFKTSEAHGLLPRHPNCRCSWIPANVGEPTKEQKKTQARIKKAIEKSLVAERPKKSKAKIATVKKKSKWMGASKHISKNRPKSII